MVLVMSSGSLIGNQFDQKFNPVVVGRRCTYYQSTVVDLAVAILVMFYWKWLEGSNEEGGKWLCIDAISCLSGRNT